MLYWSGFQKKYFFHNCYHIQEVTKMEALEIIGSITAAVPVTALMAIGAIKASDQVDQCLQRFGTKLLEYMKRFF